MALYHAVRTASYTGNGATVAFPAPFLWYSDDTILVYVAGVLQAHGVHYTLTGTGDEDGGTVTFVEAPDADLAVLIERRLPYTQEADLTESGQYSLAVVEQQLDKATMQIQQLADDLEDLSGDDGWLEVIEAIEGADVLTQITNLTNSINTINTTLGDYEVRITALEAIDHAAVTIGAVQGTANAAGASVSAQEVRLHASSATTAGVLISGAQDIPDGVKSFHDHVNLDATSGANHRRVLSWRDEADVPLWSLQNDTEEDAGHTFAFVDEVNNWWWTYLEPGAISWWQTGESSGISGNDADGSFEIYTTDSHRIGVDADGNVDIDGPLETTESRQLAFTAVTSNTTLSDVHDVVAGDATGGGFTLTLPTAVGIAGRRYCIKNSGSANTVTLDGAGAETIEGDATVGLGVGVGLIIESDGANWVVVADYDPFLADRITALEAIDHAAVTLTSIGSAPNGSGATLNVQQLQLQPASADFGGVVSTVDQEFSGRKGFNDGISSTFDSLLEAFIDLSGATADTPNLLLKTPMSTGANHYLRIYALPNNDGKALIITVNLEYQTGGTPGWYAEVTDACAAWVFSHYLGGVRTFSKQTGVTGGVLQYEENDFIGFVAANENLYVHKHDIASGYGTNWAGNTSGSPAHYTPGYVLNADGSIDFYGEVVRSSGSALTVNTAFVDPDYLFGKQFTIDCKIYDVAAGGSYKDCVLTIGSDGSLTLTAGNGVTLGGNISLLLDGLRIRPINRS